MRDPAAEVEDRHLVGEAHHQPHVVLHQQHGQLQFGADARDHLGGAGPFGGVHAGHRLVQEQHARLQAQGAGQLDTFAVAVRQQLHRAVEVRAQAGEFGDLPGAGEMLALFAHRPRQAQRARGEPGAGVEVPAEHQIVGDRARRGDDVLERAGHPERGDAVRSEPGQLRVPEPDRAGGGAGQTGEHVETGGLAGAVGPDEGVHGAGRDGEGDAVQGR